MKVANHLDTVLPLLEKLGLLQQTFMVSNSSTDKQQTLLGSRNHTRNQAALFYYLPREKEDFLKSESMFKDEDSFLWAQALRKGKNMKLLKNKKVTFVALLAILAVL